MGKVEKVVVLGVLFSVVVILAVSLYSGHDEEVLAKGDPAARRREQHLAARMDAPARLRGPALAEPQGTGGESTGVRPNADPSPGSDPSAEATSAEALGRRWTQRPQAAPSDTPLGQAAAGVIPVAERPQTRSQSLGADGLLSSNVRRPQGQEAQAEPRPVATDQRIQRLDPSWDLITLEGLTSTFDPRFQVYTCGAGETFTSVARKLYGSEKKATLLRRDNESLSELGAGQEILVAVIDDRPDGGSRYEVQEGESLWRIAKKVYGAGNRWKEIYEANQDTLDSPDPLPLGVILRIP